MLSARLIWAIHIPTCSRRTRATWPMEVCLIRLTHIEAIPSLCRRGKFPPKSLRDAQRDGSRVGPADQDQKHGEKGPGLLDATSSRLRLPHLSCEGERPEAQERRRTEAPLMLL